MAAKAEYEAKRAAKAGLTVEEWRNRPKGDRKSFYDAMIAFMGHFAAGDVGSFALVATWHDNEYSGPFHLESADQKRRLLAAMRDYTERPQTGQRIDFDVKRYPPGMMFINAGGPRNNVINNDNFIEGPAKRFLAGEVKSIVLFYHLVEPDEIGVIYHVEPDRVRPTARNVKMVADYMAVRNPMITAA
jgi:hypothetical protein